jgi:3-phosphoshikimate 1-carboxyvinyltransferase
VSARTIRPATAAGTVRAPGSKSYTHRALVAGHLTGRKYTVVAPLDSDDTRATARALRALGTSVECGRARWELSPRTAKAGPRARIDCGESGTTLRFVAGLAARGVSPVTLTGRGRLPDRPLGELVGALERLGADVRRPLADRSLPLTVRGPIHGGSLSLDASISSQFV